ncbi:flippase [Noviherbaspirillum aerium]|uniref:flippase n=1 Tax=Noviherbaspirillum aerium TaxID=2588497 RepID=UPI00124C9EDE|nr:flippase [Noviherbaspirillum aerium]
MATVRFFAFNLLGHVAPMLVALLSVPVIAHGAGVERLGALGVVWALVGYFGFLDFGLGRVVTRRVASASQEGRLADELGELRGFLWQKALPGLIIIGLLIFGARLLFEGFLPASPLGREMAAGWDWIAIGVPATLATNWLRGVLEGVHRFARVNLLRTVFGAWTYAAPAAAAVVWSTLDMLIAAIVIGRVLSMLAHALACLRVDRGILLGPLQPASLRSFFQEGGWITVSNIVGPLMVYSDRFVLAALLTPTAVAWYVTSQEVMLRTLVIPGALAGVLFPKFAGRQGDNGVPLSDLYQRGVRVVAALMLPMCMLAAACAYDGLRLWLGPAFAQNGYQVVEIVAVGIFVNAVSYLPLAWLQAHERSEITAKLHMLEFPLYAIGLVAAVAAWGIVGAAVAWTLRVSIDCLLLLRLVGPGSAKPAIKPLVLGTLLIAAAGICSQPDWPLQWRLLAGAAAALTGSALAWLVFLNASDRTQRPRRPGTAH